MFKTHYSWCGVFFARGMFVSVAKKSLFLKAMLSNALEMSVLVKSAINALPACLSPNLVQPWHSSHCTLYHALFVAL